MPSDDYAAVGGGALKLKGAKVSKKGSKKKSKTKNNLENNLEKSLSAAQANDAHAASDDHDDAAQHQPNDPEARAAPKTESERRHDEARKKRLLQMTQATGLRPELLKTHKERVEELNTYLSKLSEHHDMPKIGPG